MLIFHGDDEIYRQMSPEAMQTDIQKWNQWIGGIAGQGRLTGGDALLPTGRTLRGTGRVVSDGPYTEGKEIVSGYLIVSASSLDEAVEMAQGCPNFDTGGTVEVRPVQVLA